jgi:FkbM family methyltransferase
VELGADPQIGQAGTRNAQFSQQYSRGKIVQEAVGDASCVLDVGAYTGETAEWFASLFPIAVIWAIEPFPDSFQELELRTNPRVRPFQFAATEFNGTAELYVNAITHTNSLYSINPASRDSVDVSRRRDSKGGQLLDFTSNRIEISAKNLDTFAREHGIQKVDLLKVDVQGAELDVLRGAQNLLACTSAVMVEVSLYDYYTSSSSIGGVEEILQPHGFSLWAVTDISHNPMNGRTDWIELLYLKGGNL